MITEDVGVCITTRNRPTVLSYTLNMFRACYDGLIIVVDDNSDTKDANRDICKHFEAIRLYNETRRGIPRSKERGFRSLLYCAYQYWFDDDCYPKHGWIDRLKEGQKHQSHLLHLKEWAHIQPKKVYEDKGLISYTGATACMMAFDHTIYDKIYGFQNGYGIYGQWHWRLSMKLAQLDSYVALDDSGDYFHSFDVDGVPEDFKYHFQSSLPFEERKNAKKP